MIDSIKEKYYFLNNFYHVDMELMKKLVERRIKIEVSKDGSPHGGRNPENSGDVGETESTRYNMNGMKWLISEELLI